MRGRAIARALAIAFAMPAAAQESAPRSGAACIAAIPDSVLTPKVVWLTSTWDDSADASRASTRASIDLVSQGVAFEVRALLADSSALPPEERHVTWRDLGRKVRVTQTPDGALSWRDAGTQIAGVRDGRAAVSLVLRALDSLRAHGEAFIPRDTLDRDTLRFTLDLRALEPGVAEDPARSRLRMGFRLFTVAGPSEKQVSVKPGTLQPQYPPQLRHEGYAGTVIARFVVDVNGRMRRDSFRAVPPRAEAARVTGAGFAYKDFAEAVRRAVEAAEFSPAELGGCVVPQLVQQPFIFALHH